MRQALGENFLDSDSEYEDYTMQVIPMMVVRIFQTNHVAKRRRNTKKQLKANQAGKGRIHPENMFPLRTYRD